MNNDEQMRAAFEAWNRETGRTSIDHELLDCWESAWQAATAAAQAGVPEGWRCFHCNETFSAENEARDHFGATEHDTPACKLETDSKTLVQIIREQEQELRCFRSEESESFRAFYALGGKHSVALIREEEKGYARGLADAQKHPEEIGLKRADAAPSPPAAEPWQPIDTPYMASEARYFCDGWQAATAAVQAGVPEESDGAEEWMPLAWALCAEENGEDACNELLWSGGPIPEPWGDRWLTYEDEAKRMIALVRKHLAAAPSPQGDLRDERFGPVAMILRDICELDADDPEDPNTICINVETLERIVRKYIPAAPSPPAAEPWQPIETAPAGVRIDVYAGGRISDAIQLEAGQWHRAFNGAYHAIWPLPTHWMHLPQPPTTGDSNAAV